MPVHCQSLAPTSLYLWMPLQPCWLQLPRWLQGHLGPRWAGSPVELMVDSGGPGPSKASLLVEPASLEDLGPRPTELGAVPHEGKVFLDRLAPGGYMLTHLQTLERVKLKGDNWSIVFDDGSGMAALAQEVEQGEPTILQADEAFTRHIFVDKRTGYM